MVLNIYSSVEKGLKLNFRKTWGLIPTFEKVTVEKLVECISYPLPLLSWIGLISEN